MKKRSILAACLISTITVSAIAADDVTVPVAIVVDGVTVPAIRAEEERWEQRDQPYGPSYDCETAQGALNLIVCSDPVLSRMELEVTTLHRDRLKDPELEEEQRRWLQAVRDECYLDSEFRSGVGAYYEAVPCLIANYAERLVELDRRTGRRVLDVLVDVGIVAMGDMELDLGNVVIDLPRVVPVTSAETSSPATPHPACIDALTSANAPSSIPRAACRAGTGHLPLALDTWFDNRYEEGQKYVTYTPWHPGRWGQQGDRSGYRVVGALDNGRTLIHVIAEGTGAGRTSVFGSVAVVRGLRTGEAVEVEHQIFDEGLNGFCGGGIDEVDIANPDILRLVSTIPAETLVTLFDWFPEQFPGVTESERRRLRALKDSGDVAMSIIGSICIGRAHYDHVPESGRRTLMDVSVEVTESDRADVAHSPALACLFDILLERHPEMPAMYRPTQLRELLTDFIDTCEIPGA